MAESSSQSRSVPQLPLVVLERIAPMLQRNHDIMEFAFKDRLQLAATNSQLRRAVLSNIQRMKRRHMRIQISKDAASVNGVIVKKERRSSYSQIECIGALQTFGQPHSLHCFGEYEYSFTLEDKIAVLAHFSPLTLTSLDVRLRPGMIGVDSPLDHLLKVVASKTNLETLKIFVSCSDLSAIRNYTMSSPSVPNDSPFNHLLTLKNLRALRIDTNRLLSPAQKANLVNRSQSKITHICCEDYSASRTNPLERDRRFEGMNDVARGNITSICCVQLTYFSVCSNQFQLLDRLPNCDTVHCRLWGPVSLQKLNKIGGLLLDIFCAPFTDDVHPARTLECSVGCDGGLQRYLDEGGESLIHFTSGNIVVRLSIGNKLAMQQQHCPFREHPCYNL